MRNSKKELETLEYLDNIVEAYEEVAALRMRKVKNAVLQNREFLAGLRHIFYQVKYSYKKEVEKLENKGDSEHVRRTNGKTVSVFLSANTGLYGDIIVRTFEAFYDHVKKTDTDVAVVGKAGEKLLSAAGIENKSVKYFDLLDSGEDNKNMNKLLAHITNYETIVVFHGKFKDILTQSPSAVSITGDVLEADEESDVLNARFIFEPSLEGVLSYFENEILASIFDQAVNESSLSKYASRMISLDRATERISKRIKETRVYTQKVKHKDQNTRQQNVLAGIYSRGYKNA